MNNPKVSIIVPCWGVENYLNRCVQSLVQQTLQDIEIILVDDGSPDKVPQMCDEWAAKDSRIKVIHKKNEGLGYARNSGIEIANGEYIAFCDSDDCVKLDAYEVLYKKIQSEEADIVYGWISHEMLDGHWEDYCMYSNETVYLRDQIPSFAADIIAFGPGITKRERLMDVSACMALYSRKIMNDHKIRFFSERDVASEDMLFTLDFLLHSKKVVLIPFTFYFYYHNNQSLSSTFKESKFDCFKRLRKCLIDRLSSLDPLGYRANRVLIGYTRAHVSCLVSSHVSNKISIIDSILKDSVWCEIRPNYHPHYLPFHARIFLSLLYSKQSVLFFLYCKLLVYLKRILKKAE